MNKINKNLLSIKFVLFLGLCLFSSISSAASVVGRVVSVIDGDTVIILNADNEQVKVRLLGIDAPEKKQAFGQVSKRFLSGLIYNQSVTVEYYKTDRNNRALGKIYFNGVDINLELVKAGMAWWYEKYQANQTDQDRVYYYYAQATAAQLRKGLWQDNYPIPPWEFRHPTR